MRAVPDLLAERMESGAASLCHVWILTRTDGVRLGFTDHDQDLTVAGVLCSAASGWTGGAAQSGLGFVPGSLSAEGALDSDAIDEGDIAAGLYDGARLEQRRVDWSSPELEVLIWRGQISRLVRQGEHLMAEIEGPLAALDRVVGRTFGRLCDADLGDRRCRARVTPNANGQRPTCDKRYSTCQTQFANGMNFQGFPHIPGDDFLTLYPTEGGRNDGRSRRT